MAQLSQSDRDLGVAMEQLNILEDIDPTLLGTKEGAVILMCGDGDHAVDKFGHFADLLRQCGSKERPHLIAVNGGGIWLAKSKLLTQIPFRLDEQLIWQIKGSLQLKKMNHVFLCAHAPCGMAKDVFNLSLYDVVKYVFQGKERLKAELATEFPNITVKCFLHQFDSTASEKKRKTRFLNKANWNKHEISLAQYDDTPESNSVSA